MKKGYVSWVAVVLLIAALLVLNYQNNPSFAQSESGRYLMSSPNSGVYIFDTQTGSIYYTGFNVELSKVGTIPK